MSFSLVFALGLTVASQTPARAGDGSDRTTHALLVGCTSYPALPSRRQLKGPGNDVALFGRLLTERFKVPPGNIRSLTESAGGDRRPTYQHIKDGLCHLAAVVRAGDHVVVLLAGHGCQLPAAPDDPEELDGLDEVFLPSDAAWDPKRKTIDNAVIDNELNGWLGAIQAKGASVWLIADSCHSGGLIRGNDEDRPRTVPELVPDDLLRQATRLVEARRADRRPLAVVDSLLGSVGTAARVAALYAAQPNEFALEVPLPSGGDQYHGLLTYTLCEVLNEGTPMTHDQLLRLIHARYRAYNRLSATPMIEGGEVNHLVLDDGKPGEAVPLTLSRRAGHWTVDGGSLLGLSPRSILAVYPETGAPHPLKPIGHVRIVSEGFRPFQARVEPWAYDGKPAPIALGERQRCRPVFLDYGDQRLKIAADGYFGIPVTRDASPPKEMLSAEGRARLDNALKRVEASRTTPVRVVANPAEADWIVRGDDASGNMVYFLPASGLPADNLATVLGPFDADPATLEERLGRIARATKLIEVAAQIGRGHATDKMFDKPAGIALDVVPLRFENEHDRKGKALERGPRGDEVKAGDLVGFRVTNRGDDPVDVTLLFVDSGYGILPFFPRVLGEDNRLPPHGTLLRRARVTADTTGEERLITIAVKARALEPRADFSFLGQATIEQARGEGTTRGADVQHGFASQLGTLLQSALFAEGTRRGLDKADLDDSAAKLILWRTIAPPAARH